MSGGVLHAGGIPCPYAPCRATLNVKLYLRHPGDEVPTLSLIDPHPLDAEHALPGERCPSGLMRLPLEPASKWALARDRVEYMKRAARAAERPSVERAERDTAGVPEHPLTPHPVENAQWFVTSAERKIRAMTNPAEIKAQIGLANMAMAEAQGLALQAGGKVDEARMILAGLIGATAAPLGIMACASASDKLMDAQTDLHQGIEQNSLYAGGL